MLVPPFRSAQAGAIKVHHNQSECLYGNRIATQYMRSDSAGLPLCPDCADIAAAERRAKAG